VTSGEWKEEKDKLDKERERQRRETSSLHIIRLTFNEMVFFLRLLTRKDLFQKLDKNNFETKIILKQK
jgi:hypothetical protein